MATDFHVRVREVLEGVLQQRAEDREAFIVQAAEGDADLLREVRSLLPHYLRVAGFEPQHPDKLAWRLPGTTTFSRAADVGRDDLEWTPPFSIAPYTVVEILGRGGMGVVYRAIHPTRHVQVAIKVLRRRVLSRADRRRFKYEEEVLRQLKHPGIARFLHGGVARILRPGVQHAGVERRPYFVMEYIAGQPVTCFAAEHGLTPLQRLTLLCRVCEAVEYAHHRGIVHCDLKPDNILVDEAGQPKILDFGIAQVQAFESSLLGELPGTFAGTPAYASPEQRSGRHATLTPASDVYTLGLVAHELLTGQLPIRDRGRLALRLESLRLLTDRPADDPVNAAFCYSVRVILATAFRKTRGQRYASAGEMGADLEAVCRAYSLDSGWRALVRRLGELVAGRATEGTRQPSRLLAALLRKRIGLAMEHEDFREQAGRLDECPDGP
jgi:serine/threonine protein kinase